MATFDVSSWLTSLGLPNLIPSFIENGLTEVDILKALSETDLKDCGVTILGQRKKVFTAIAALGAGGAPATPAAATPTPAPAKAAPVAATPKLTPIPEIRRAKYWPGAPSGGLGKLSEAGSDLKGEFETNPFLFIGDELAVLGYGGVSFWRPAITMGAHKVLQNPNKKDWTYRGFDILGNLMVTAGGYTSIRADVQIWNLTTSQVIQDHHRASDSTMWDACFLDQSQIFIVDYNHTAQILDVEEGFTTRRFKVGTYCNRSVRDPLNNSLVYVSVENAVRIYDIRVPGDNYSLGLPHNLGKLPGCGFVKNASIKENELFVGSHLGTMQFDCRSGIPIAQSKQVAKSLSAYCNILAVGHGAGISFFDTNQGLANPVHQITDSNSNPNWMEMNEKVLCFAHWGDHLFAVTWAPPPAGKK